MVYVTGAGATNALLGAPDLGVITLTELASQVERISDAGGYLLYLRQEGRGIGLYNKLDAAQELSERAVTRWPNFSESHRIKGELLLERLAWAISDAEEAEGASVEHERRAPRRRASNARYGGAAIAA